MQKLHFLRPLRGLYHSIKPKYTHFTPARPAFFQKAEKASPGFLPARVFSENRFKSVEPFIPFRKESRSRWSFAVRNGQGLLPFSMPGSASLLQQPFRHRDCRHGWSESSTVNRSSTPLMSQRSKQMVVRTLVSFRNFGKRKARNHL